MGKNARLNAKIDSENGTIIMGNEPQVPYQQIISRTHNLNVVTTYLVNQLNIKAKAPVNKSVFYQVGQKVEQVPQEIRKMVEMDERNNGTKYCSKSRKLSYVLFSI